jgi:hypothetical protein
MDKQYLPDDNVLLFSVESGIANQFIIDLRKNCKRGMEGKASRGWQPALAPIGYLNEKAEKTIIEDLERFHLIRKMWDMMLTGNYAPNQIRKIANEQWGFRTNKTKRGGGTPLSISTIYKLFSNIFYTGMFEWNGTLYNGNHKPMVTFDEYDRVQVLLGKKGKPRAKTHEFAYTGLMRCGICDSMYTATEKVKQIKSTGNFKTYTYYHCTRKKNNTVCLPEIQKPIPLLNLEEKIDEEIVKNTIRPEFFEWAMSILEEERKKETNDATHIIEMKKMSLEETEKELNNLTRMRYRELIDDEMYIKESTVLKEKIAKLKYQSAHVVDNSERYIQLTENTFRFATYARKTFDTGSLMDKREILSALGSNCLITGEKLFIEASEWFLPIQKGYPLLEAEYSRLELDNTLTDTERNEALQSITTRWCTIVEDVRTVFEKLNDPDICIPSLKPEFNNIEIIASKKILRHAA